MRKQRAFAVLTEEEIDQIAAWLRGGNYDAVRERVGRPRPEGFGLIISNKPLQLLYAKTNIVRKVNRHLPSTGQVSLSEFETICDSGTADSERSTRVHTAILKTTYELATARENTPAQLLALQRLADLPARAASRARKAELEASKTVLHRNVQEHRAYINQERIVLAKRSFDLRERELAFRAQKLLSSGNTKNT